MISRIMLRGSVAAAAIALSTAPAYAGSAEILLKRLHEKGILTEEEYKELKKEGEPSEPKKEKEAEPYDMVGSFKKGHKNQICCA